MIDPTTAWQRLRHGNETNSNPRDPMGELAPGAVTAAIFRCSDSAVPSHEVFGQRGGSLLDVSTFGHVLDTGVLATLEFAVQTLRVPLIVVLGHSDCSALRTAQRAWEQAGLPEGATRCVVEQVLWSIARRHVAADSVEAIAAAHTIETGLGIIQRSPVIAQHVDARACAIVCAGTGMGDAGLSTHATIGPAGERQDSLAECV